MSPGQLYFAVMCEREEERATLFRDATAARAAQADRKGWKAFQKDFGDGDE